MHKQNALLNRVGALQFADGPPVDGENDAKLHNFFKLWRAKGEAQSERFTIQALIDEVPDYLWVKDTQGRFVIANRALALDNGRTSAREMIGLSDFDLHSPEAASGYYELEQTIVSSGRPMIDREESIVDAAGAVKWVSSTKMPLRDQDNAIIGLIGVARDITERKRADINRVGEARILEMIAMSAPLEGVLDGLVSLIETQTAGIHGSILLLSHDGVRMQPGAAPSMPAALVRALDGLRIGPRVGSCGTAIYRREKVIVADIMSDPLWEDYRDLVAAYGYRSCWSMPILSHQGEPLGAPRRGRFLPCPEPAGITSRFKHRHDV